MAPWHEEKFLFEYRKGKFSNALALIEAHRIPSSGTLRATLAELYQLTGDNPKAMAACEAVLRSGANDPSTSYRAHEVLAAIFIDEGRVGSAKEHLARALELAQQAGDLQGTCRLQLRLVPTLSELEGPASAAAFSSEVRRNVLRSGDPHLLALLHLRFAQLEAKSGLLDTAWRHLDAGWRLLEHRPNYWIDGLLSLDASSVASMNSEFGRAKELATRALQCGQESGHMRTAAAALSNLCTLALQEGNVAEAGEYADRALPLAGRFESIRASLLDTTAQVAILVRHNERAIRSLAELDAWLARRPDLSQSWLALSVYLTRIRLMRLENRLRDALALCDRAILLADTRQDSYLGVLLRLTKADLLTLMGRPDDAWALVLHVDAVLSEPALVLIAEFERVKGRLELRSGELTRAADHVARARRIVGTAGTEWNRRDVAEAILECSQSVRLPLEAQNPDARTVDLPEVHAGADFAGSALLVSPVDGFSVEAIVKLQSLVSTPELFAFECESFVRRLACSSSVTLNIVKASGTEALSGHSRLNDDRTAGLQPVVIAISPSPTLTYEIRAVPGESFQARTTLLAVKRLVENAVALETLRRQQKERTSLWPIEIDLDGQAGLFASAAMRDVLALAHRIAQSSAPVLITGETGVGKEVIAREIHARSPQASGPFVPYNCTAVPREMMDSQLFGHRRGAFTHAMEHAPGLIRSAQGGTVFLDEIGELGLDSQPKLLRFLESSEVQPIGEPKPVRVNVRVIAATNADLGQLVRDGRFREDLFYRLDILRLPIPPLRERREEIPAFCSYFLGRYCRESRKPHMEISDEALEYLVLYDWPGNVRELAAEMRRIAALAPPGAPVTPADLSSSIRACRRTVDASQPIVGTDDFVVSLDQPLPLAVEALERAAIERALRQSRGRVERAADSLGISRKGLFLKRKRLGLPVGEH